jgi:hypothetical protein
MTNFKQYRILEISTNGSLTFKNEYFYTSKIISFSKKDKYNFEIAAKNKEILKKQLDLFSYYKKKYTF